MSKVSFAQRGMWVTERLVGAGTAYNVPLAVRFGAGLDGGALLKACAAVVDRHPVLSMTVREVDGELELVPGEPVAIGGTEEPFDLDRGPLARFTLDGRTLSFVAHHLVFDGHSKDVLVRDLAALYNGRTLPALEPAEDEDFAALLPEAKAYWAEHWREPGETVVHGSPLRVRRAGDALVTELRADPQVPGLTRFETLIAALHVLLAGYGTADVVTAIDLSTRSPRDEDRIGVFVNELPISSKPSPEQTFAEFGALVRERLREVYRFRAVPLAAAVPNLRPHAALTPVSVSYRARTGPDPVFDGVEAEVDWTVFNGGVRGSVHLQCVDGRDGLLVSVRHLPDVDGARLAVELGELLAAVTADPETRLGDLVTFSGPVIAEPAVARHQPRATTEVEQVREIWQEVLGVSPILDDDDIFDLGGHSLSITQIIARMEKRLGLKVELDDFFDHPTIAGVMGTASHD
ncbi:condensation domain-containing protein [Nonomuraea sp. NPDC050556]|uniref:condensation domain-containing protein n=1 Tax=Nonomuraea sp. NPDC050556 TaxID=3364369 RepID=UPI0037AF0219